MRPSVQADWEVFCRRGDESAFLALYEGSKRLVWTLCRRLLIDREDAEDAMQSTYARLLAAVREDPEAAAALDWTQAVYRHALREADRLRGRRARRHRREVAMELPPENAAGESVWQTGKTGPDTLAMESEFRARLETLLALLPDEFRLPMQLHYLHGMTLDEIGRMVGKDKSTVSRRIGKGLKRLKPMAERAGLGEALGALGVIAGGAALLEPPAALAGPLIWAEAQTAAVAVGAGGAAGLGTTNAALLKTTVGGMAMKAKTAITGGLLILLAGGALYLALTPETPPSPTGTESAVVGSSPSVNRAPAPMPSASTADATNEMQAAAETEEVAAGNTDNSGRVTTANDTTATAAYNGPTEALLVAVLRAEGRGTGIEGATVGATKAAAAGAENWSGAAITDSDGLTTLALPAAWTSAEITAAAPWFVAETQRVTLPADKPLIFSLKEGGRIFGTVRYADDGRPAAGAAVKLDYPRPIPDAIAIAEEDGSFEMMGLPPGDPKIVAQLNGLRSDIEKPDGQTVGVSAGARFGSVDLYLMEGVAIVGTVTDIESDAPVGGATVEIRRGIKTLTKADGGYRLDGVGFGQCDLTASAEKYAKRPAIVVVDRHGEFKQDFALDPAVTIRVRVTEPDNRPIEGAEIKAHNVQEGFVIGMGSTDTNGRAAVPHMSRLNPPILFAEKQGYTLVAEGDGLNRSAEAEGFWDQHIVLKQVEDFEKLIVGRVSDPDNNPIEGVRIAWVPRRGPQRSNDPTLTGPDGMYRLAFKTEGLAVSLNASKEGWGPQIQSHILPGTPDQPARVDFMLESGHWLAGRVIDEEGNAIAGVEVSVMPDERILGMGSSLPEVERSVKTDENGAFRIEGVGAPTVGVDVFKYERGRPDEWTSARLKDVAVDREIEIVLRRIGLIRGRVVDAENGDPVKHFTIKLTDGGGYATSRREPGETFSSEEGRFVLRELDRGENRYSFKVVASGYGDKLVMGIEAVREEETDEITVELSKETEIVGWVVDPITDDPIEGARVVYGNAGPGLEPIPWDYLDQTPNLVNTQSVVTEADGLFRFEEGEPGTIFVQARGYERKVVPADDRDRWRQPDGILRIALQGGLSLRGKLIRNQSLVSFLELSRMGNGLADAPWLAEEVVASISQFESDGGFTINGLRSGKHRIMGLQRPPIGPSGTGTYIFQALTIAESEEAHVIFGEGFGPIVYSGRLLDTSGQPHDRVYLELTPRFDWQYERWAVCCFGEAGGYFYFGGLRPGRYGVRVLSQDQKLVLGTLPDLEIQQSMEQDITVTLPGAVR